MSIQYYILSIVLVNGLWSTINKKDLKPSVYPLVSQVNSEDKYLKLYNFDSMKRTYNTLKDHIESKALKRESINNIFTLLYVIIFL